MIETCPRCRRPAAESERSWHLSRGGQCFAHAPKGKREVAGTAAHNTAAAECAIAELERRRADARELRWLAEQSQRFEPCSPRLYAAILNKMIGKALTL